jgi:hypothetical protein
MTKLDIINRAFSKISVEAIPNLTDPGKSVETANLLYPGALDSVLRSYDWACLIKQVALVEDIDIIWEGSTAYVSGDLRTNEGILFRCTASGTSAATGGPASYAMGITDGTATWDALEEYPENYSLYEYCYIYPEGTIKIISVGSTPYSVNGRFIYTDEENAIAKVLRRPFNVDVLDSLLQEAIVLKLAEYMAPTFGQAAAVPTLIQEYQLALRAARGESAAEKKEDPTSSRLWTDTP